MRGGGSDSKKAAAFSAVVPRSKRGTTATNLLPAALQPPQHVLELVKVAVVDLQGAVAVAVLDADLQAEHVGETLFQRGGVSVFAGRTFRLDGGGLLLAAL